MWGRAAANRIRAAPMMILVVRVSCKIKAAHEDFSIQVGR